MSGMRPLSHSSLATVLCAVTCLLLLSTSSHSYVDAVTDPNAATRGRHSGVRKPGKDTAVPRQVRTTRGRHAGQMIQARQNRNPLARQNAKRWQRQAFEAAQHRVQAHVKHLLHGRSTQV